MHEVHLIAVSIESALVLVVDVVVGVVAVVAVVAVAVSVGTRGSKLRTCRLQKCAYQE